MSSLCRSHVRMSVYLAAGVIRLPLTGKSLACTPNACFHVQVSQARTFNLWWCNMPQTEYKAVFLHNNVTGWIENGYIGSNINLVEVYSDTHNWEAS